MTGRQRSQQLCVVLALCGFQLLTLISGTPSSSTADSEYKDLSGECVTEINSFWTKYYSTTPEEIKCKPLLETALELKDPTQCPPKDQIIKCFLLQKDAWLAFVVECNLFHYHRYNLQATGSGNVAAGGGEGTSSSTPSAPVAPAATTGEATSTTVDPTFGGDGLKQDAGDPAITPGCFPQFQQAHSFYLWLEGKYDFKPFHNGARSGVVAGWVFAGAAAVAAAVLLLA